MADYPERPKYFAHKFVRRLSKSCAAMEIGPEACWLLTVIAFQEDSCRYKRAVLFYDEPLASLVGLGSERTLARCREKAVKAGWLHYEAGRKRVPGRYWVLIPDHAEVFDDSPIGVDDSNFLGTGAEKPPSNRRLSVNETAEQPPTKCRPFIPYPNPYPENKTQRESEQQIRTEPVPEHDPVDDVRTDADPHWDWVTIEADFLKLWNDSPSTCKVQAISHLLAGKFRDLWVQDDWRAKVPEAISRLTRGWWAKRKISLNKFLDPIFVGDICGGYYDRGGDSNAATDARGSRKDKKHLTAGGHDNLAQLDLPF